LELCTACEIAVAKAKEEIEERIRRFDRTAVHAHLWLAFFATLKIGKSADGVRPSKCEYRNIVPHFDKVHLDQGSEVFWIYGGQQRALASNIAQSPTETDGFLKI
jgi:hypothetical protein